MTEDGHILPIIIPKLIMRISGPKQPTLTERREFVLPEGRKNLIPRGDGRIPQIIAGSSAFVSSTRSQYNPSIGTIITAVSSTVDLNPKRTWT